MANSLYDDGSRGLIAVVCNDVAEWEHTLPGDVATQAGVEDALLATNAIDPISKRHPTPCRALTEFPPAYARLPSYSGQ